MTIPGGNSLWSGSIVARGCRVASEFASGGDSILHSSASPRLRPLSPARCNTWPTYCTARSEDDTLTPSILVVEMVRIRLGYLRSRRLRKLAQKVKPAGILIGVNPAVKNLPVKAVKASPMMPEPLLTVIQPPKCNTSPDFYDKTSLDAF